MSLRPVGFALLAGIITASELPAQETLLEEWTLGYLAGGWSSRWAGSPIDAAARFRPALRVRAGHDVLSLRETVRSSHSSVRIQASAPVGSSSALRLFVASDSWSLDSEGRRILGTARSGTLALGADLSRHVPGLGGLTSEAWAGWDDGVGGLARVGSASAFHRVLASGWRTHSRPSQILFPADSLREVGVGHPVTGWELEGSAALPFFGWTVTPRLAWTRELFQTPSEVPEGFLSIAPDGAHELLRGDFDVLRGAWGVMARYRRRSAEMESGVSRAGVSAGMVPVARLELDGWSGSIRHRESEREWVLEGGVVRMEGELSARIETWPFVELWQVLSAQAYRLNGDVDARSRWVRLRRASDRGLTWAVEVGHTSLTLERDSWYVTSFGFGRSGRQRTLHGADAAVFVGGQAERRWGVDSLGEIGVRLRAGAPVYGRPLQGADEVSRTGLAGYLGVRLEWTARQD